MLSHLYRYTLLLGDDLDIQLSLNLLVNIDLSGIVTDGLDVLDNDILAVHIVVMLLLEGLSNHDVIHATEQLTILTDLDDQLHSLAVQSSLLGLSVLAQSLL